MANKKSVIILLVLLVFIFFASLVISKNIESRLRRDNNRTNVNDTDNTFALEFIKSTNKNENYLVSPYSVEIALNMLGDGALGNTAKEIDKVLNNRKVNILDTDMSIANGIFIKDRYKGEVRKDYLKVLKKKYDSDIEYDSFETPDKINKWVSNKTKKMIPELFESLDGDFVLALVNAIAMDVKWEEAFNCNFTLEEDFKREDGTKIKVAMMHNYDSSGKYFETSKAKGIILPYKGKKKNKGLELIAILPNDIKTYAKTLDVKELEAIDKYKMDKNKELDIAIPKFTYDYDLKDFANVLQDMGIKEVFDPSKANLSKMIKGATNGEFYVSKAVHKTHIELDEKGTKAAAATGFAVDKNAVVDEKEKYSITFNKPFIYIIRDKESKQIVFFGAVYEPNKWEGNKCDEK